MSSVTTRTETLVRGHVKFVQVACLNPLKTKGRGPSRGSDPSEIDFPETLKPCPSAAGGRLRSHISRASAGGLPGSYTDACGARSYLEESNCCLLQHFSTMASLTSRVLGHPRVQAVDVSQLEGWQQLASVFVKAFDDKGQRFPIDLDEAYVWLQYGRKDSALRTLKAHFTENTDYICAAGEVHQTVGSGALAGSAPDKYYLTTDAFENFAMGARTEAGDRVRAFFRAIRDAYVELTTNPPSQQLSREKALELLFEGQGCLYLACIHESSKLYKYGCSTNLPKRNLAHRSHFKPPYSYRLEMAWKADRPRDAEDTFKGDPLIKEIHEEVEIGGTVHREIIRLPDHVDKGIVLAIAERAAHKTQNTIQHLYVGGSSNDEKSKEVLLAKEKTRQADIQAKVRLAELDHELKMEELRLKCARKPSGRRTRLVIATEAGDAQMTGEVQMTTQDMNAVLDASEHSATDCLVPEVPESSIELETSGGEEASEAVQEFAQAPQVDAIPEFQEVIPEVQEEGGDLVTEGGATPHSAYAEGLISRFIEEHCIVDNSKFVTSKDFHERLLTITNESEEVLGMRRVGVFMHKHFRGGEFMRNSKRCRGYVGLSLKEFSG